MNKTRLILIDLALLLVTILTGLLDVAMVMGMVLCGMRAPPLSDVCAAFMKLMPVFNVMYALHWIALAVILVDIVFVIFSRQKRLIGKKLRIAIPAVFIASSLLLMTIVNTMQ